MKVCQDKFPDKGGYYMDGYLKSNLDMAKKATKADWDICLAVDGPEGSGKSMLAQQIAFYLDNTFNLSRIAWTPDQFKKAVYKAEPFQCVVFDEAFSGLTSRATMSKTNKAIVGMLTEIRAKNLFLIIILPSYFDLDRYVALWRSRCLIHVYHDKFKRGFFSFYSYKKKKDLYVNGKKYYNYRCVQPDFRGRFTNFWMVDKDQYKEKKLTSLRNAHIGRKQLNKQEIEREVMKDIARNMYLQKKIPLSQRKIAFLLGITTPTVNKYVKPSSS